MASFFGKVLIIDNDANFLDGIKDEVDLLEEYPCLLLKNFKDASVVLKQDKHNIRLIFISTTVGSSKAVDELKEIKKDHSELPVILISRQSGKAPPADSGDQDQGFKKILINPANFQALTREIDEIFTSKEKWIGIEPSKEEKNVELSLADDGYIPTLLSDFILTPKSFFNVFHSFQIYSFC